MAEIVYNDNDVFTATTPTGVVLTIKPSDPYGFWKVSASKGRLPDWLMGSYTSSEEANTDVRRYLSEKLV